MPLNVTGEGILDESGTAMAPGKFGIEATGVVDVIEPAVGLDSMNGEVGREPPDACIPTIGPEDVKGDDFSVLA